jgi:LysM repeat protein
MGSYCSEMKQFSILLAVALLATPAMLRAQDAATEERFNKLAAQIEVLIESKDAQNRKIEELARAIDALQQQMNKPSPSYASQEDVKLLAEKLREADRNRKEDDEKILEFIRKEFKSLSSAALKSPRPTPMTPDSSVSDRGFEYVIQPGDTLSVVIAAYREKGVKVTLDQIKKANPGLNETKLKVGQTIFIPAPQ